ncbi:hypothetical protein [Paraburkholderia fungorum]|uniref:hypothetical protein n=1 Tax=Paraburkholderia fungorum TaxID=134537 RepID=UPI0038B9A539
MNAGFETKVREIASGLEGELEFGSTASPSKPVFLLSLRKVDMDAHLELQQFEEQGLVVVAVYGVFPFHARNGEWPMPYDEVAELAGVHRFYALMAGCEASADDIVQQIRERLLPPYLQSLKLVRVALRAPKQDDTLERLVTACGSEPMVRGPKRFISLLMGERRVALMVDVQSEDRVALHLSGLSVAQAEGVVRQLAGNKSL